MRPDTDWSESLRDFKKIPTNNFRMLPEIEYRPAPQQIATTPPAAYIWNAKECFRLRNSLGPDGNADRSLLTGKRRFVSNSILRYTTHRKQLK